MIGIKFNPEHRKYSIRVGLHIEVKSVRFKIMNFWCHAPHPDDFKIFTACWSVL